MAANNALKSANEDIACIVGTFVQYRGKVLVSCLGDYDREKKRIYLGGNFSNAYLTHREIEIYYYTLLGKSAAQISHILDRSKRTVEYHLIQLKSKLKCATQGDLIATAITTGLTYSLFNGMSSIAKNSAANC